MTNDELLAIRAMLREEINALRPTLREEINSSVYASELSIDENFEATVTPINGRFDRLEIMMEIMNQHIILMRAELKEVRSDLTEVKSVLKQIITVLHQAVVAINELQADQRALSVWIDMNVHSAV